MDKTYWTGGWTDNNFKLLAQFQNWQTGADIKIDNSTDEIITAIIENGNIGGTEMRKIIETDYSFVFISTDGGYRVLNVLFKDDLKKSNSIEI